LGAWLRLKVNADVPMNGERSLVTQTTCTVPVAHRSLVVTLLEGVALEVPDPLRVALDHIAEARRAESPQVRDQLLQFAGWAVDDARHTALEQHASEERLVAIESVASELSRIG
jgi:hypothetical protein